MSGAPELKLLAISGSLRRGSFNTALARALAALAPAGTSIVTAPSIGVLPLYDADIENDEGFPASVLELADAVRAADGVIIVTPEYNYSVPGVLKNAIDWVSRVPGQPFSGKPVLIQSASPGMLGGARAQYHLRQILVFLEAQVFNRPEVFVAAAHTKIDKESGALIDEATRKFAAAQLAAFAAYIRRVAS